MPSSVDHLNHNNFKEQADRWHEAFEQSVDMKDWNEVDYLLNRLPPQNDDRDWFHRIFTLIDAKAPEDVLVLALDVLHEQVRHPIAQWHGVLTRLVYFETQWLDLFLEHPYGQKTNSLLDPSVLAILPVWGKSTKWEEAQGYLTPSLVKEVWKVIDQYHLNAQGEEILQAWVDFIQQQRQDWQEDVLDELRRSHLDPTPYTWSQPALKEVLVALERKLIADRTTLPSSLSPSRKL